MLERLCLKEQAMTKLIIRLLFTSMGYSADNKFNRIDLELLDMILDLLSSHSQVKFKISFIFIWIDYSTL